MHSWEELPRHVKCACLCCSAAVYMRAARRDKQAAEQVAITAEATLAAERQQMSEEIAQVCN